MISKVSFDKQARPWAPRGERSRYKGDSDEGVIFYRKKIRNEPNTYIYFEIGFFRECFYMLCLELIHKTKILQLKSPAMPIIQQAEDTEVQRYENTQIQN